MSEAQRSYLPAAGHRWLLPLYDPLVRLLGGDSARATLLDEADIRPGHRVLDVGCGTGTLLVQAKRRHPDADLVGLDPDPRALARARRKAARAGLSVRLDRGFSDALPYPAASFDRVLSSFVLHHLEPGEKVTALREARRVLEPGGLLLVLDFGGPGSERGSLVARWLHSTSRLRDNVDDRILALMREAGFRDATALGRRATLVGPVTGYRAAAPPLSA